ncbi:MAG TPA: tRNA pseudouridine(55) synthase TruB [Actinomycetota bacterium]|nr:tRNA pseudouridine(55) synthase TruB [Actinomycetota bacterium]
MSGGAGPDGVLLIDKPSGITSHDAVDAVRRALRTRKVGHAGTLDPMATGLLVVGVGRATRLLRFLGGLPKTYEGTLRLGTETDTLDADGVVTRTAPVQTSRDAVAGAMAALVGDSMQRPPAFSAVKVRGRKLYDAARAGEAVEAEPRPIHVDAFDLIDLRGDDASFRVVCSGGTYVRVLAADVGAALGCGAHLTRLRRTAVGPLRVDGATPPDAPGKPLPLATAVAHLPQVRLDDLEAEAASHGRILAPAGLDGPYAVSGPGGELIGIYRDDGGKATPEMILAARPADTSEG